MIDFPEIQQSEQANKWLHTGKSRLQLATFKTTSGYTQDNKWLRSRPQLTTLFGLFSPGGSTGDSLTWFLHGFIHSVSLRLCRIKNHRVFQFLHSGCTQCAPTPPYMVNLTKGSTSGIYQETS